MRGLCRTDATEPNKITWTRGSIQLKSIITHSQIFDKAFLPPCRQRRFFPEKLGQEKAASAETPAAWISFRNAAKDQNSSFASSHRDIWFSIRAFWSAVTLFSFPFALASAESILRIWATVYIWLGSGGTHVML